MEKYVGQEFGLPSGLGKKLLGVVVVIVVLSVLGGSFGTVGAGERGVLLRFGAVTGKILDE